MRNHFSPPANTRQFGTSQQEICLQSTQIDGQDGQSPFSTSPLSCNTYFLPTKETNASPKRRCLAKEICSSGTYHRSDGLFSSTSYCNFFLQSWISRSLARGSPCRTRQMRITYSLCELIFCPRLGLRGQLEIRGELCAPRRARMALIYAPALNKRVITGWCRIPIALALLEQQSWSRGRWHLGLLCWKRG